LADLLRERRLSDEQPLRGTTEVQFLGDRTEITQVPQFNAIHISNLLIMLI
jgi:hypothetical protein